LVPLYEYHCLTCQENFTFRHSYKETISECHLCKSTGCVEKVLSKANIVLKKALSSKEPIGQITNESINDARQDLEIQKKELKKKNK